MSYPLSFYYIDNLEFPTPEVKELREARPGDRIEFNFAADFMWRSRVREAFKAADETGTNRLAFKAVTGKYYLVAFDLIVRYKQRDEFVIFLAQVADDAWELGKDPVVIELLKEVYA